MRARSQLTELRAADLRFTPAEAAEFLNPGMGLNLSTQDIAALERRTEGWIAGLQLAALSIQGRSDTASFIQAFTGSHRFVLDYLVEEVLQRQPERVRSFLLQTAILERLSGPLCDAVCSYITPSSSTGTAITKREDARDMLESLERGNLFIVPLDDRRQWYRYHHLFADVLQARLAEEQPDQVPGLHRRASKWYEQNGLPADAIRHALAAEDFERAAGLIELAWPAMDISYQSDAWLGWVKKLPDEMIRARPVLSVGYAWALLDGGELEACESRLQDAERWLGLADNANERMVVVDEEMFRSLPAAIATARAYRALALNDVPANVQFARQALDLTPEQDHVRRIQATALLGLAQYSNGDLEAAAQHLQTAKKLGEQAALIGWQHRLCVAQSRILEAKGDLDGALDLLDEAERQYIRSPLPEVRPIAALKARVWLKQGKLAEAQDWARERGLSVDDDLSFIQEFEHIPLARLFIARYKGDQEDGSIHEAVEMLEGLLKAAEEGGRMGSVIEILVLHALAHQARGNIALALAPLERALAEPEGYVQIFVDEGMPMAALLQEAAKHGAVLGYAGHLRAAFGKIEGRKPVAQPLVEPLSERELEVLRLLRTELSGPEIAHELVVSLNTLRTHTKNIFSKLGVNNRRAAVRRAEELDLF